MWHKRPSLSIFAKAGHFTSIGVTALNGQPVMHVVIAKGKKRELLVKSGVQ